ncbi:MAG: hypothetical protein AMS18_02545 [Gemmatimonas sp. SG8_17]|nr:MAG: hypothetical protein AMS18_02545 [Gemmatimonas sp. SG8_17]
MSTPRAQSFVVLESGRARLVHALLSMRTATSSQRAEYHLQEHVQRSSRAARVKPFVGYIVLKRLQVLAVGEQTSTAPAPVDGNGSQLLSPQHGVFAPSTVPICLDPKLGEPDVDPVVAVPTLQQQLQLGLIEPKSRRTPCTDRGGPARTPPRSLYPGSWGRQRARAQWASASQGLGNAATSGNSTNALLGDDPHITGTLTPPGT